MAPFERKDKRMLTYIPETSKSVEFRFAFVLIGVCAKKVAELIINSDMAEQYQPTAAANAVGLTSVVLQDGVAAQMAAAAAAAATAPAEGATTPAEGAEPTSPPPEKQGENRGRKQKEMRCFCPVKLEPPTAQEPVVAKLSSRLSLSSLTSPADNKGGEETEKLCRIAFSCVEQFSDSLPNVQDVAASRNTAFVFVVNCQPGNDPDVKGQLSDLEMRLMEMKGLEARKIHVQKFVIFVNFKRTSEKGVAEEWAQQKLQGEGRVWRIDDTNDAELFEAVQEISEVLANKITNPMAKSGGSFISEGVEQKTTTAQEPAKKGCCTVQ